MNASIPVQEHRTRCEVWTRVMGFYRPVSHFNLGKKSEHYSRKQFQECIAANEAFEQEYGA
ncbi:MAG: oxidoreductase [Candidatus Moranbacteria bacterium]|nr:oxidoreductase [Candidatus Moranbacteria bacterium]